MDKFVLHVPKWQGELLFTKELLVFAGVIILMLVGILFCFWGYKYFKTVLFLGVGTVACYVSFLLIEPMTGNLVIRMFLTVSLTFLGICIVYFLDIIWGYFLDKLRIRNALGKNIYLIAAPLGAAIIGLAIYWFIWRGLIESVVIAAVCGVGGLVFQYFRRAKAVRFKCYNDLLRMPRPKADEDGLEYIVMETAAAAGVAAAVAVPEPATAEDPVAEPEPEEILPVAEEEEEPVVEPVMAEEPVVESVMAEEPVAESETGAVLHISEMDAQPAAAVETITENVPAPEFALTVPEPDPDILEDALFVRQMNEYLKNRQRFKQVDIELAAMAASRHAEAVTTAKREAVDVMSKAADAMTRAADAMDRVAAVAPQIKVTPDKRRNFLRKRYGRIAKGAAAVAAGIGLFIAGRASKGRD
ncbi:MAG: hypothetical protein OSJ59_09595 [Lachnospiraceae bacterium]|nr:hypothetical protein [Lachnospiraceae bacterium]